MLYALIRCTEECRRQFKVQTQLTLGVIVSFNVAHLEYVIVKPHHEYRISLLPMQSRGVDNNDVTLSPFFEIPNIVRTSMKPINWSGPH